MCVCVCVCVCVCACVCVCVCVCVYMFVRVITPTIHNSKKVHLHVHVHVHVPCLADRIGNGSPNFQKMYMKKSQALTDRTLASRRCCTEGERERISTRWYLGRERRATWEHTQPCRHGMEPYIHNLHAQHDIML